MLIFSLFQKWMLKWRIGWWCLLYDFTMMYSVVRTPATHSDFPFSTDCFLQALLKVVSFLIKYIHYSDRKLSFVLKERYKLFWHEATLFLQEATQKHYVKSQVISNWFSVITSLPTLEQMFPDWNMSNQPSLKPTQELTNDSIVFFSSNGQTRTLFWYYNVFTFWQWALHSSDYFVS